MIDWKFFRATLRLIEPLKSTLAAARDAVQLIDVPQIERTLRELRPYIGRDHDAEARDVVAAFHDEQRKGDV